MHNNRALEFVTEAYCLLQYPGNFAKARIYVDMALGEIRELLAIIQHYESAPEKQALRIAAPPSGGVLVEDTRAMIPARLVAPKQPRAALPGNGKR
ncbi:MAG: hypothetical protein JXR84_08490 [Anaerolineae bacterium]|nr:hypothetical protein [Anaerolineae bacterium]